MKLPQTTAGKLSIALLIPEAALLIFFVTYGLMWSCFLHRNPALQGLTDHLAGLSLLLTFPYLAATPTIAILYFYRARRHSNQIKFGPLRRKVVTLRFALHVVCWLAIPINFVTVIFSAAFGVLPPHLECLRYREGPDTEYARAGYQKLLEEPVPAHVSNVYFQARNTFVDQSLILEFTTPIDAFVDGLIDTLQLRPAQHTHAGIYDSLTGNVLEFDELYRSGYYSLYYNRETGNVKFEWITF